MLYFEDLAPGQTYAGASLPVSAAEICNFAAAYDPQPFHLDDAAARSTLFGGLAASGWHTAALTMRMIVDGEFRPAGGILGIGGELNWLLPVRPGDTLSAEVEVIETRPSRSRPRQGVVSVCVTTRNQRGETVQTFRPTLFVDRRLGAQ